MFADDSIAAEIPEEKRKPYLEVVDQGIAAWKKALEDANATVGDD